ncbi:hypothetical protein CTAYLR_007020 [Chrysophaeum taylorii]|uniref:J domain-containing protein n=1 Tax=Chrysophaeum taylorii TaxID=2483200 RepID=A0AAD7U7Q5_9STRA|nr:hypothetical protein CTAYLR_007020 [Chrysophaeum taylorii]
MSSELSYYARLGVKSSASQSEIDGAYRRHALALHPDRPGGDAGAFQELNRIHKVLSDKERRAEYDRIGAEDMSTGDIFASTVALVPWVAGGAATGGLAAWSWRLASLAAAGFAVLVFHSADSLAATRRRDAARLENIAAAGGAGFVIGAVTARIVSSALALLF